MSTTTEPSTAAPRAPVRLHAVRLGRRSSLTLVLVSLVGLAGFGWPLLAAPSAMVLAHSQDAPLLFALLLPLLLGVLLAELSEGHLDAKAVALLGVLSAVGAGMRALGAGTVGIEPVFFLLLPAGRVLGRGFGFLLGCTTLLVSALLTGGVGPWLPFQMIGAGWVGFGAGCVPRAGGRWEVWLLAAYGVVAGLAYGILLNLWAWPFAVGLSGVDGLSFVPGAPLSVNLVRFAHYSVATSLAFDVPRGITTAVLMLVAGRPVLAALRRGVRKAAFDARPVFEPPPRGPVRVSAL